MNTATALIIVLSSQGHWFGGQSGTISVDWSAPQAMPPAVLSWELTIGPTSVRSGEQAMNGPLPSVLKLTTPQVRTRTVMHWHYRLLNRETSEVLERGERSINVYPRNLLEGVDRRLKGKSVRVWDTEGELTRVLEAAKLKLEKTGDASQLRLTPVDVVIVAPGCIDESAFSQEPLVEQARSGANVLVFEQKRPAWLAGYVLGRRPVPPKLDWRLDHRLLDGFGAEDAASWLAGPSKELRPLQLPADEPVLEIAYWPREAPGTDAVPIDALLASKMTGNGRLVLCQIPLGPWEQDPRSQSLLANMLNYVVTRPEPTAPPSRRRIEPVSRPASMPTITIPPGAKP